MSRLEGGGGPLYNFQKFHTLKQFVMVKKILTIVAVLFIAVSQNCAYAQYALEMQSDDAQDVLCQQNKISVELGKGVQMSDAGRTLLYTGASFALSGLACYIGGSAMYDSSQDAGSWPLYPIFAMAGAATGGILAVVGLPLYLCGNAKMKTYGSSHLTFGKEGEKGAAGFFELGLALPGIFGVDAVGGYNFGKNFFMGAGVGCKMYLVGNNTDATASLPIYANFRYSMGNKRVAPYVGASVGYDILSTGLYSGLEFGTRIRKIEGKGGESWWLGAKTDFLSSERAALLSFKVGRSF